jgi:hypothetical protein
MKLLTYLSGLSVLLVLLVACALLNGQDTAAASEPRDKPPGRTGRGWTPDEAMAQLHLYPRDSYLQYVALQLARREGRDVGPQIGGLAAEFGEREGFDRASRADLFNIFSGALAVQESLQLDTMTLGPSRRAPRMKVEPKPVPTVKTETKNGKAPYYVQKTPEQIAREERAEEERLKRRVPVASLTGPTIKSHPWEQMLGGAKPEISSLALHIPADFYCAEFRSLNKMLELMDTSDLWGTHLLSQGAQEARTQLVGERLKKQLAVETNRLLRPFYDLAVERVAVTGSDLFIREGSDVTLIFRMKQPDVFKARMDQFLATAEKSRPDAKRTTGNYQGIEYTQLATADRAIHVFSAYPTPDLHVRSNSRVAFERILQSIQGKDADGRPIRRLGETSEFAYIRTLLPQGAKEEDGLIYLSDPFIRRLVGPQLKLTERRRMLCHNYLCMIAHAALMYRTEYERAPESLNALAKAQCAPGLFGEGELTCPDGGKYSLAPDGMTGVCSHHGHATSLTPCCEIPLAQVTTEEAEEYHAFLQDYNQYWRTFFDPIAIRVQVTPERYRLETIVLPLIDNSIYTGMSYVLGGKPEPLDALPVPKRNILSVAVRVNKEQLLKDAGIPIPQSIVQEEEKADKKRFPGVAEIACANQLKQIGLALHNYHDVYSTFPAMASFDKQGKPLLSWRVHILPFIEQDNLYREFHLDEPWDSEHNKKLIARMPAIYRCPNQKESEKGKTTYLAPVGRDTMFTGNVRGTRLQEVTDGTSNTIMLVDAADKHAVTWTKPDDLKYDADQPLTGLAGHHSESFEVLFVDGSVHLLRSSIDKKTLQALFTRNGGEIVALANDAEFPIATRESSPSGPFPFLPSEVMERLRLGEFLAKGIGNQIGLHVYDAVPLFDLNLPGAFSMLRGNFTRVFSSAGTQELMIGFLAASLNAPVYISVPVNDRQIVDDFLTRLDSVLLTFSRQHERSFFGNIAQDFYSLPVDKTKAVRTYSIGLGPVKWRVFWGRIGDGLYVASKSFILEDLIKMEAARSDQNGASGMVDRGSEAHGMLRMRPKNWNQVLADFRLGWAENNRQACLQNVGPLSSLARAYVAATSARSAEAIGRDMQKLTDRLYGVHYFCPEGGHYLLAPDGKRIGCSVHGSADAPRQPAAPVEQSAPSRLLRDFTGLTASLTFMEDGLHAVVVIDRK